MRVYLDTSVIVSLFCGDQNAGRAQKALGSDQIVIVISNWTTLEFVSVIARMTREGALSKTDADALLATYRRWVLENGETIVMADSDVAAATVLVANMTHNLRGPDALHIAIALACSLPLLTFDRKMAEAARALSADVIQA